MRKTHYKGGGLAKENELATRLEEIDSRTQLTRLSDADLQQAVNASSNKIPATPKRRFGPHPADPQRLPL